MVYPAMSGALTRLWGRIAGLGKWGDSPQLTRQLLIADFFANLNFVSGQMTRD